MAEPRMSCELCALKHVGQARALWLETYKGYPEHFWFALGHLAEAEDELVRSYPELADKVRQCRKDWELSPKHAPDFGVLVNVIAEGTGYDPRVMLPSASVQGEDPLAFWRGMWFSVVISAGLWYCIVKVLNWVFFR